MPRMISEREKASKRTAARVAREKQLLIQAGATPAEADQVIAAVESERCAKNLARAARGVERLIGERLPIDFRKLEDQKAKANAIAIVKRLLNEKGKR